ncbi:type IV secretion system DNA-binding domain-containing protein [Oscillatoria sp. CS-180]|uniref:type IV secretory system conjugative DNA transfer family protein n=1 Tax=Oscillatoria sp. CS-180 TaxID=3021720 RepID=UPI00232DBE36|nr:type IV secretion system DNA-binding domain-containing protein [Oscillatoria sp. CS-180]MDB9526951.1 type IV secretion system DNA-binding domain-containing protein [Oscillatoria sp. CS-180]
MLLIAFAVFGVTAFLGKGSGKKAKLADARWATRSEQRRADRRALRQIKNREPAKVSLSIGLPGQNKSQHFPDVQRGVAVLGAPGSGKTYSVITPLMVSALLQGFPIILYDYKYPGQTADLAPLAKHLGYDVHIFAPGYPESSTCNLLDFMASDTDMAMGRQIAHVLYRNAAGSSGSLHNSDSFFTNAGEQIIVAALSLAKGSPYPDLASAQAILRLPGLTERLHTALLPLWNRLNFDQLLAVADSERTVASILGTAAGYFTRFMDPNLLNAFIGASTLPLVLSERQLIVIGMDRERRDAVGPLIASVLHMLVAKNTTASRATPLIVGLDELPTLYLPSLAKWINECRDQGLCLILGAQNLAQMENTYGSQMSRAIFGACATKALFNPGEPASAQTFSDLLGEEEITFKTQSKSQSQGKATISRSVQRRIRKLFAPSDFLRLPPGQAVFLSPGYGNTQNGSLPARIAIRVPLNIIRLTDKSRIAWKRLRSLLIERQRQPPLDAAELETRMRHAETLLPSPDSTV